MVNIWKESYQRVKDGSTFRINFERRNLMIGKKYIIKDGKYEGSLGIEVEHCTTEDILKNIELTFNVYHHSVPSARSDARRKRYFRAPSEHELSDDDMLYGEHRELAQFCLEFHVLAYILLSAIKWEDFAKGKWFWQSSNYPSLIMLKEWFEPTNKENK